MKILRVFRLVRVFRLLRAHGARTIVRGLLENRAGSALLSLLLMGILVLEVGSLEMLNIEQYAPGANITTGSDALWYVIVTISTVGYGDRYPVTNGGRFFGAVIIIIGVGHLRHLHRLPGQPLPRTVEEARRPWMHHRPRPICEPSSPSSRRSSPSNRRRSTTSIASCRPTDRDRGRCRTDPLLGEHRVASVLIGAARRLREEHELHGRYLPTNGHLAAAADRLQAALGDDDFDEALTEGAALTWPDAVAYGQRGA